MTSGVSSDDERAEKNAPSFDDSESEAGGDNSGVERSLESTSEGAVLHSSDMSLISKLVVCGWVVVHTDGLAAAAHLYAPVVMSTAERTIMRSMKLRSTGIALLSLPLV